jgi:hypothetical protein
MTQGRDTTVAVWIAQDTAFARTVIDQEVSNADLVFHPLPISRTMDVRLESEDPGAFEIQPLSGAGAQAIVDDSVLLRLHGSPAEWLFRVTPASRFAGSPSASS